MYLSPGASPSEVGDIDVIAHDGVIHCFHLVLPNHDLVAHITSTDGLSWQQQPPALRTGDPGSCDDDMIWTMQVVRHPQSNQFNMYYTGCATAEHGQVQRVALATSDDLVHWTRHSGNPILTSHGPHYNEQRDLVGFISFRDPFVFIEDGTWHMLVTARTGGGPRFRRGCIAHATSSDGLTWEAQQPLYAPEQFEDCEVPSVLKIDGRYFLFFHDFAGHNLYRMADRLGGPWRAPVRDMLLPERNFVFRFAPWKNRTLLFHTIRADCDWKRRSPSSGVACLAPPKELGVLEDGQLALRSFSGWSDHLLPGARTLSGLSARGVHGQRVHLTEPDLADFILEADVTLDNGRALGLAFRCDRGIENCYWLRLNFAEHRIELHRQMVYDSSLNRFKLRKAMLQSVAAPLTPGKTYRLRLLACRAYVEVSLDDVVYLSAVTYACQRGHVGAFLEDAAGGVGDMRIQQLQAPWSE